jgi:hypothetical protein
VLRLDFAQKQADPQVPPVIQSPAAAPQFSADAAAANGKAVHNPKCIYTSPTPLTDTHHQSPSRSIQFGFVLWMSSNPMLIRNSRGGAVPPPPPPPRHLADTRPWEWANSDQDNSGWGRSIPPVAPGPSLYGSFASRRSHPDEKPELLRHGSSFSTVEKNDAGGNTNPEIRINGDPIDEGYTSLPGTSTGSNRLVCQFLTSELRSYAQLRSITDHSPLRMYHCLRGLPVLLSQKTPCVCLIQTLESSLTISFNLGRNTKNQHLLGQVSKIQPTNDTTAMHKHMTSYYYRS